MLFNCGTSLGFQEDKGQIDETDPLTISMVFWLGRTTHDGKRQIARLDGIVNVFKGKLASMIKEVGEIGFVALGL